MLLTSALAPLTGESIFRFFLGPIAASAVRLASLCLIWASSCCCIWNTSSNTQISFTEELTVTRPKECNHLSQHTLTSLAFCFSRSCSGSSWRDRDCSKATDSLIFHNECVQFIRLFYSFTHWAAGSVLSWQLAEDMYTTDTKPRSLTLFGYVVQCVGFFLSVIVFVLIYHYLGSLQENLSLLLFLSLFLYLIQVLKEFKLGTNIADLLAPLILLMDQWRYGKVKEVQWQELDC